jgi:hypothetical protein
MKIENPIRLVRELKGAPLSIVFILSMVQQRVTQEWLERATGYTDKPVSQALAYLQEIGLVDHSRSGWQLTSQAQQLPLPLDLLDGGQETDEGAAADASGAAADASAKPIQSKFVDMSRKYSDSLITITTESLKSEEEVSNSNNSPGRKNSDSGVKGPDLAETIQELRNAGVVGKRLASLAALPHVTPAYVRAWDAQLQHEKGDDYKPGLLIYTIESGAPAPPTKSNGHILPCSCDECNRLSYSKYSCGDDDDDP